MLSMSYPEMATFLLKQYLTEYDESALLSACEKAYGLFDDESVVPVVKVDEKLYILELFHGPTLAFKDVALKLLPVFCIDGGVGLYHLVGAFAKPVLFKKCFYGVSLSGKKIKYRSVDIPQ